MSVRQFPGEPTRFLVSSSSRALEHVIDVAWQEWPNQKPHIQCGCERGFAQGKPCCHLIALAKYLHETAQV